MLELLGTLSGFSIAIPAIAFLLFRPRPFPGKTELTTFVLMSLVFEATFLYTSSMHLRNVHWSHIYALLEFTVLFLFMRKLLMPMSMTLQIIAGIYILCLFLNPLSLEPWQEFNPFARTINSLLFILLSILYFFKMYQEEIIHDPVQRPEFWAVTGLLFYFCASFFTFLLSSTLLKLSPDKIETSWFFHSVSNVIKNVVLTIGIWMAKR